jgi:hypothetical protein
VGPDQAAAWSAALLPPFKSYTGGFINRRLTVRKPRFETALDFRRGPCAVRVSEASMKRSVSNGTSTFHEHRIEVATAPLVPMKLNRRLHTDVLGRPVKPGHVLARVNLPVPVDTDWVAFTSDPYRASRALAPEATAWLSEQLGSLPWSLTFENGLLYTTWPTRIQPETLLTTVDALLGLLDRIPGSAPG